MTRSGLFEVEERLEGCCTLSWADPRWRRWRTEQLVESKNFETVQIFRRKLL